MGGQADGRHLQAPTERGRCDTARQDTGASPGGAGASEADKEEKGGSEAGEAARTTGRNRKPERGGGESVHIEGSDNTGKGLCCRPPRNQVPQQPLLNRHQVGGVSCSPDGLFARHGMEPTRGRPAVRVMVLTQVAHTSISNPPMGAHVPPTPLRVPPPPPSVSLPCFFTHQGTMPPSTSGVGLAQVSGHGTQHDSWELWSRGAHGIRRNHDGARSAHMCHGERWSNWTGVLGWCWLLWGSFYSFCCTPSSAFSLSTTYLAAFPCA